MNFEKPQKKSPDSQGEPKIPDFEKKNQDNKTPKGFGDLKKLEAENPEFIKPDITIEQLREICGDDKVLKELLSATIKQLEEYIESVVELEEAVEKKDKADDEKMKEFVEVSDRAHKMHDNTVDAIRILVRNLAQRNKDTSWARDFFSGGQEDRAAIARFSVLIMYDKFKKEQKEKL